MILVHGGAGRVPAERHAILIESARAGALAGHALLAAGGSALDAVIAAVRTLEDDPELNAGLGSALTRDGTVETDAAVMDGATMRVGAVAAVPDLGTAVALARAVLDDGEHVLLAGSAAWRFAAERGIVPAPPGSLVTERATRRLAEETARRAASAPAMTEAERSGGTVGAVARDRHGGFAAATSTGGIVYKRSGRVGDSPIPGAGTWADHACAISATGDGEAILRVALARGIACRIAVGQDARSAARAGLDELASITGGQAGLIVIDHRGHAALRLSPTMPVAWVASRDGIVHASLGDPVS